MVYYSQYKQDQVLSKSIFKNKQNGIFVELGSGDGIRFSNTAFFEKEMGWTGLCIEANPFEFNKMVDSRSCYMENAAVSDEIKEITFLAIEGEGKGLSGIVESYDPRHQNRIEFSGEVQGTKHLIKMKTVTMSHLLEKYKLYHIDYFSLDVEGAEMEVLRSIDFEKFHIRCFTVENNYGNSLERAFLKDKGYKLLGKIGIDDVLVKI